MDNVSEVFEAGANDTPSQAQRVIAPVAVNGRLDQPGDQDCVIFSGIKGQRLSVPVLPKNVTARAVIIPADKTVAVLTIS